MTEPAEPAEPTLDQSYCDVDQHAPRCTGYTQDERDPEACNCDCHDIGMNQ